MTQAAAATNGEVSGDGTRTIHREPGQKAPRHLSLEARLQLKVEAVRKHRSTLRFFREHRWLLDSSEHRAVAAIALRRARQGLARATKELTYYRRAIRVRDARRLAAAPPRVAICNVFGRYCGQAVSVAWCESRLSTVARNGQYLGLFQMGSYERRLFGHGRTAHQQAIAAHKYFVLSGRDWSPWGCRWAAY